MGSARGVRWAGAYVGVVEIDGEAAYVAREPLVLSADGGTVSVPFTRYPRWAMTYPTRDDAKAAAERLVDPFAGA